MNGDSLAMRKFTFRSSKSGLTKAGNCGIIQIESVYTSSISELMSEVYTDSTF